MSAPQDRDLSEVAAADDNCTSPAIPRSAGIRFDPRIIQAVDPSHCRLWPLHPRALDGVNRRSCHSLIRSIAAHGQLVPALGRHVLNDPEWSVEIICGSRRLFAARDLGIPLLVQIRELSNWECALAVELENRLRRGLSRSERDFYFKALMDQALGQSSAGPPRLKDYDTVARTRTDKPLFAARSYYNVVELVFPHSVDDKTIDLIKGVIAEALDPPHLMTSSGSSAH